MVFGGGAAPSHSFEGALQLHVELCKLLLVSQQRIMVTIRAEMKLLFLLQLHLALAYRLEPSPQTNSIFPAAKIMSKSVNKDIKIFYQSGVSSYWRFFMKIMRVW